MNNEIIHSPKRLRNSILKNASKSNSPIKSKNRASVFSPKKEKEIKFDYILTILKKPSERRTKGEIRILSDYLSNKYDFFKKLNNPTDKKKLEKLVSVLNYEEFSPNKNIITFGEEGDKFYILLQGNVTLFKPNYPQKIMTIKEYIYYLNEIKYDDENKLNRILEKNYFLNLDMDFYLNIPPSSVKNNTKIQVFVEEEESLATFEDGFSFGEIALLKKTKRNATIKTNILSKLVSINKSDYNKIIRELEEKRLEKELKQFKIDFSFFKFWTLNHLIKLFNNLTNQTLIKGDYLFHQNEDYEYIFIIEKGKFEIFSLVSLGWGQKYLEYILDNKNNLIKLILEKHPHKEKNLLEVFDLAKENKLNSPMIFNPYLTNKINTSYEQKVNFLTVINENKFYFNKFNYNRIKIKNIDNFDILGLENCLEFKNYFYFAKCVSPFAEVKKIKLYDFYKILSLNSNFNLEFMFDYINKKKLNIINQVKVILENKLEESFFKFEKDFDDFIKKKGRFKEKFNEKDFSVDDVVLDDNKTIKKKNNNKINLKYNFNSNNEEIVPPQTIKMNTTLINFINLNKSQQFNRNYNISNKPSNKYFLNKNRISLPVLLNPSNSQRKIFTPLNKEKKISFFSPTNSVSTSYNTYKNNQKSRNFTSNLNYFNSLSNKNNSAFDKNKYLKEIETNNSYFTNEMLKLAGINSYNNKNNNKYNNKYFDIDNEIDKKLIVIESEKKTMSNRKSFKSTEPNSKNESSLSLNNVNKNTFNNPSRMTEINMKYFRSLRKNRYSYNY